MATEKPALPPPPPTSATVTVDPKPGNIAPTYPPSPPTTEPNAIHRVHSPAAGSPPSNMWNYLGPDKVPGSNPVTRCRFSLFGLPAMLGSSSWNEAHEEGLPLPPPTTEHNNHISVPVDPTFSADDLETIEFLLSDPEFQQALHHKSPAELPASTPQDAPPLGANSPVKEPALAVTVINSPTTRTQTHVAEARDKAWRGPLHMAVRKGNDRIPHPGGCNERDSGGATPLSYAVTGGFEAVVRTLVAHGARIGDVDERGRNALHWAASQRREGVLRALLELGCCASTALVDSCDGGGMTPLHMAIENGFEGGVDLLLQYGADINYKARVPSTASCTTTAVSSPGDRHTCSDLYWALKGGSNNFGIVTNFRIKTLPGSGPVWGGLTFYPKQLTEPAIEALADFTENMHKDPDSNLLCFFAYTGNAIISRCSWPRFDK
ncbi:hypothetical protein PG984_009756 [Apiospora sp. TS-2023a]